MATSNVLGTGQHTSDGMCIFHTGMSPLAVHFFLCTHVAQAAGRHNLHPVACVCIQQARFRAHDSTTPTGFAFFVHVRRPGYRQAGCSTMSWHSACTGYGRNGTAPGASPSCWLQANRPPGMPKQHKTRPANKLHAAGGCCCKVQYITTVRRRRPPCTARSRPWLLQRPAYHAPPPAARHLPPHSPCAATRGNPICQKPQPVHGPVMPMAAAVHGPVMPMAAAATCRHVLHAPPPAHLPKATASAQPRHAQLTCCCSTQHTITFLYIYPQAAPPLSSPWT